jgi:hypothetical protein
MANGGIPSRSRLILFLGMDSRSEIWSHLHYLSYFVNFKKSFAGAAVVKKKLAIKKFYFSLKLDRLSRLLKRKTT